MSNPKLYVRFPNDLPVPFRFEHGAKYEVIRTVDAVATDGSACLNFLLYTGGSLIFVPSFDVEVVNWEEFCAAIEDAQTEARRMASLIVPGNQRH